MSLSLAQLCDNAHVLHMQNEAASLYVLFSYSTPVGCKVFWKKSGNKEMAVTDRYYSHTTSKHINDWLALEEYFCCTKSQEDLTTIISSAIGE